MALQTSVYTESLRYGFPDMWIKLTWHGVKAQVTPATAESLLKLSVTVSRMCVNKASWNSQRLGTTLSL